MFNEGIVKIGKKGKVHVCNYSKKSKSRSEES
jgi:hypothetical protein